MEAGRELDALVAEMVLGYKLMRWINHPSYEPVIINDGSGSCLPIGLPIPRYSTDIAAAWQVVEKLAELGMLTSVCWGRSGNHGIIASVDILEAGFNKPIAAPTAPLAICLAALKALNISIN